MIIIWFYIKYSDGYGKENNVNNYKNDIHNKENNVNKLKSILYENINENNYEIPSKQHCEVCYLYILISFDRKYQKLFTIANNYIVSLLKMKSQFFS